MNECDIQISGIHTHRQSDPQKIGSGAEESISSPEARNEVEFVGARQSTFAWHSEVSWPRDEVTTVLALLSCKSRTCVFFDALAVKHEGQIGQ